MKKLRNNIPNLITISRIISCFLGATFFITGNVYAALSCYAYGGISDAFDGYFARKLNAVTDFGKDLDALSDKIYALSLIAPAIIFGNFSMIIPLVLEAAIAGINSYSKIKYKKPHTEKVGKIKTCLLFPTMIIGLLATKIPNLYAIYLPLMIVTADFQAKSMLVYYNQLQKTKKEYNDSNIEEKNIQKSNNDILEYNNIEDINYQNIETKTITQNNKKLVRRKDYNDRH